MDQHKRELRKLKKTIKQAGNKRRRQDLKRDLAENPEEAHLSEENLGKLRSDTLNGLDKDSTRKPDEKPPAED